MMHATRRVLQQANTNATPVFASLKSPIVLLENNHLLAVYKPPGWQSVPNKHPSPKCLMAYLKQKELGGGSQKKYLKPIHRLDQPCSGVLLYGKTTKASSRLQTMWEVVEKTYHVVVDYKEHIFSNKLWTEANHNKTILRASKRNLDHAQVAQQRTVQLKPDPNGSFRLDCRLVSHNDTYALLHVQPQQGTRHVIRSVLAAHRLTIVGDLRYGHETRLADQSVALHATRLQFHIAIGKQNVYDLVAPLPEEWKEWFDLSLPEEFV